LISLEGVLRMHRSGLRLTRTPPWERRKLCNELFNQLLLSSGGHRLWLLPSWMACRHPRLIHWATTAVKL
jgi:hypothetical protein